MAKQRRANGEGSWVWMEKKQLWKLTKQYDGKSKSFYGKIKEVALNKAKEYEIMLKDDANEEEKRYPMLKEYATWWLWNVKINSVKRAAFDRVEDIMRNHILDEIGHIPIDKVTTEIIQIEVINKMMNGISNRTHKRYSYSSIKQAKDALGSMFKYAVETHKLKYSPVPAVKINKQLAPKPKKIKFFTTEERAAFIKEARRTYKSGRWVYWYGEFLIFLLYTGMRCGEGVALQWKHIDLENRTVEIDQTVIRIRNRDEYSDDPAMLNIIQDSTKSNILRTIYLSNAAYESLIKLKKNKEVKPDDYIITSMRGNIVDHSSMSSCFKKILKKAGIQECGIHTLRHSCASMLYANGVSMDVISMILGHSSIAITQKVYAELIDKDKVNRMKIIQNIN